MRPTPYYECEGLSLYRADCLAILPTLDAGSVDAIVTDPPYGTKVDGDGYGRRQKWNANQQIVGDEDLSLLSRSLPEMRRILLPNAWAVLFCSPKRRDDVGAVCRESGLRIRDEIVWDKKAPGLGGGLRYQHESILLCSFGEPSGRCELPSILAEWVPKGQHGHREQHHVHEKPLGVVSRLIRYVAAEDALIVDPFTGSGTTLVAAMKTGRRAIGIEIDERYCAIAARRCEAARTPFFDGVPP
jgi:DNA modification methylase